MIETRDVAESALWYALFLKRLPDEEPLPEPLTVDDLAAECGLCRSWFIKKFRKEYGITPIEFLNNFRIKVALQLLRGSMSITDVAIMSGFGSTSDFYRHFMMGFGCPPSEYRKRLNKSKRKNS